MFSACFCCTQKVRGNAAIHLFSAALFIGTALNWNSGLHVLDYKKQNSSGKNFEKESRKGNRNCTALHHEALNPFLFFPLIIPVIIPQLSPPVLPQLSSVFSPGLHSCCTQVALGLLRCEAVRAKSKVFPLLHPFPGCGRCGVCWVHFFQKHCRSSICESLAVCNTLLPA